VLLALVAALFTSSSSDAVSAALAIEGGGDDGAAISAMEVAVRKVPTWSMARLELGRLMLKQGANTDAALIHLDIARSLSPENPRGHYLFALAAKEQGHAREARAALEVALSLRADYEDARSRLASMQFESGDYRDAVLSFRAYTKAHPEATTARLQLALALERTERSHEAEAELRLMLRLPGARVVAARRLAEFLERQGRATEASRLRESQRSEPRRTFRALRPSSR
jgi:predicted Zn-dependent protease